VATPAGRGHSILLNLSEERWGGGRGLSTKRSGDVGCGAQRHESHGVEALARHAAVAALDQPEMLEVGGTDRDDAAAAFGELVDQRFGQVFGSGGGEDGVERRVLAKDLDAVAGAEDDR